MEGRNSATPLSYCVTSFATRLARFARIRLLRLLRGPLRLTGSNPLVVEAMHIRRDLVETIFYSEMTRLEPMHFGVRKVFQVRLAALAGEEYVVLSPENQRLGLLLAEKLLPLGVELNIRAVVVMCTRRALGRSMKRKSMFQLSGLINSGRL